MKHPKRIKHQGATYRLAESDLTTTITIQFTGDDPISGERSGEDYVARLTHLDGVPYQGDYDDMITSEVKAKSGHAAIKQMAEQWARAGFLD